MLSFTLSYSGYMLSSIFFNQYEITTKHNCIQACSNNENCSSFFFNTVSGLCHFDEFVYTETDQFAPEVNTLYYRVKHESCPADYTYYRSTNQCLKVYKDAKTFPDAQTKCQGDLGHLVYPKTQEQNAQLIRMRDTDFVWIGANKTFSTWKWLDGQPLGPYYNWRPTKPDGEEVVFVGPDGMWDDHFSSHLFYFVCEIDVDNVSVHC